MAQRLPGPLDPTLPQDYERERLSTFDAGVNYALEPNNLPPNALSEAENIYWFDGQILVDTGYAPFGPQVLGQPQLAYQVYYPNGTSELLLLTTSSIYRLLGGNMQQWQYVHYGGPSTITTAAAAASQANIVVGNPDKVFVGAHVRIPLVNGILTDFIVQSVSGVTIALSPNIPAPGINASAGVSVVFDLPNTATAVAPGDSIIKLSTVNGIVVGNQLGLQLSNGQQWQFQVGAVAANVHPVILFTPASPFIQPRTPGGTVVASYSIKMSDGTSFVGTVALIGPEMQYFSLSSSTSATGTITTNTIILATGPLSSFCTLIATPTGNVPPSVTVAGTAVCPAPGALQGAACYIAPTLNGSLDIQPSAVVFPANSWVILSNGHDPLLYYYQGVASALPGLPDGTTCRAMNIFHEQLILLNTTENGMDLPQQVRASDQGDPTGWTPTQNGIAAIYPLVDTEDFILSANLLGPWLIIYRETTIMRCTYLGLPNQTLFFEYMIYGEGIQSQGSVAELGETHFLVGTQNIYTYDGGYALVPIGNNIFSRLLSAKGELNPQAKSTIFTQYVGENDEVLLFYPSGTGKLPSSVLRCSLEKNAWFHRTFPDTFVSAGYFLPLLTTTWASAVGTWAQNTASWDSRVFLLNAPVLILCAPAKQSTFVYDYTTKTDNGAVVPWSMVMKDVGRGDAIERWDSMLFYGQGTGIKVEYALDPQFDIDPTAMPTPYVTMTDENGAPLTLEFGAGLSRQRLTFGNASTYIRVRLSGTDPNFSLVYAEMWSSFESEY